jgi:hypothetical protein
MLLDFNPAHRIELKMPDANPHARAGEGGGLPKGLSLFRFVLFSFLMLGAAYGGTSLHFNALPLPGDVPPNGIPSAQWEPSPLWSPSWLLIKAGVFVRHDADGYRFTSKLGQAAFASLSIVLGIVMFAALGWIAGEVARKWWVQNRGR